MDTCCCYFLDTVDNSEDHRSANVHLKPCSSIHAVGLLECMSVLSSTVSAAAVRSPQLRVPVHLRTGLWFPNHHHLLVLVPSPPPVVVIAVLVSVTCPSTTAPVDAVAGDGMPTSQQLEGGGKGVSGVPGHPWLHGACRESLGFNSKTENLSTCHQTHIRPKCLALFLMDSRIGKPKIDTFTSLLKQVTFLLSLTIKSSFYDFVREFCILYLEFFVATQN